ncbi:potassium channel family protein [Halobaculum sp. MBLA0143]|uniref:potassium channel family protein n=1 Tax=Halobaculum sp. MBLA0143 TaxID=3079933 RepID=UPI003525CA64
MKDTAELLIDLSYSAVVFEDRELAEEALALEEEMDLLQLQARMSLVMAGRSPEEAERLAPVFGVVDAAEKVSDAAGDVAGVVLGEIGLPAAFADALPEAVEPLARVPVAAGADYVDRSLGELGLETETGVRVFTVRRADDWLLHPDRDTVVRADDVLLCRGPADGLAGVYETATGEPLADDDAAMGADGDPATAVADVPDLERAVETVVTMKDASELAVDLAYGSVLFDSPALAREVRELEVEVDALQSRFEAWVLRAATDVADPVRLRGLLRIGASTEAISDAALEISEGVLRGLGSHPVVEKVVEESDEVLVRETVAPGSKLDGTTVGDAAIETQTGMRVVAVRRADANSDRRYVLSPPPGTTLSAGDVVIAKGTRAGATRLADWTA